MENIEDIISNEDKVLSLLCHLSMIFGGIIMPIIIWAIKKEQSEFVRFHSLQSIFFHLAFAVILAVFIVVVAVVIVLTGVGFGSARHSTGMPAIFLIIVFIFSAVIILLALGGTGYSIYLAVKSYQGEKTKIPIIGKIIYDKVYGSN
jgi:uncharacterized protein